MFPVGLSVDEDWMAFHLRPNLLYSANKRELVIVFVIQVIGAYETTSEGFSLLPLVTWRDGPVGAEAAGNVLLLLFRGFQDL